MIDEVIKRAKSKVRWNEYILQNSYRQMTVLISETEHNLQGNISILNEEMK